MTVSAAPRKWIFMRGRLAQPRGAPIDAARRCLRIHATNRPCATIGAHDVSPRIAACRARRADFFIGNDDAAARGAALACPLGSGHRRRAAVAAGADRAGHAQCRRPGLHHLGQRRAGRHNKGRCARCAGLRRAVLLLFGFSAVADAGEPARTAGRAGARCTQRAYEHGASRSGRSARAAGRLFWVGVVVLLAASCALEKYAALPVRGRRGRQPCRRRARPSAQACQPEAARLRRLGRAVDRRAGGGPRDVAALSRGCAWPRRSAFGSSPSAKRAERIERAEDIRLGERATRARRWSRSSTTCRSEHLPIVIGRRCPAGEIKRVAKERQKPLFTELADTKLPGSICSMPRRAARRASRPRRWR